MKGPKGGEGPPGQVTGKEAVTMTEINIVTFELKLPLHVLGEHTGMKLSCIKPTSKVRGLSIEPRSSTGCID